jgi:hypothetical protein
LNIYYVTKITKHLETIKVKTQNENINDHNVNFIIKPQVLIKQWNQDLKLPQISKNDESTLEISHPYSNTTYTIENKKPKLLQVPVNDMQSYDIENENENMTFIDETNVYSSLHIKTIRKEKYKLNDLQAISFENFIANTTNNQLLQYARGAVGIGKTQIIKAIQDFFLKMGK